MYFLARSESGFDVFLCCNLVVLGVDEASTFIAIDGILAYFFKSCDAMDGFVAANDG